MEAVTWGDASALAASVGAHGASALHSVGDLGSGLPGPAVAAAIAAQVSGGDAPGAILIPRPTTAGISPAGCRPASTGRC